MHKEVWRSKLDAQGVVGGLAGSGIDPRFAAQVRGGSLQSALSKMGVPWSQIKVEDKIFSLGVADCVYNIVSAKGKGLHLGISSAQHLVMLIFSPQYQGESLIGWTVYGRQDSDILKNYACKPEDHWQKIIDTMPCCISYKDINLVYTGCNLAFARAMGFARVDEVIGKTDYDLFCSNDSATLEVEYDRMVLATNEVVHCRESQLFNGSMVPVLGKKVQVKAQDGTASSILSIYVISELSESTDYPNIGGNDMTVDEFAGFISKLGHDFRTPLAGIIGLAQRLCVEIKEVEHNVFAYDIYVAANQLMHLCNYMLDPVIYNDIYNQGSKVDFSWKRLVQDICEFMMPAIKNKGLKLEIEYDGDFQQDIYGHRIMLQRVLTNLLSNAVKYTANGQVKISTQIQADGETDGLQLTCSIQDTGKGIPPSQQDIIFGSYTRGDYADTHKSIGDGLGLYIVKQFIEKMSGTVQVNSQVNKGSCFTFKVPIEFSSSMVKKQDNCEYPKIDLPNTRVLLEDTQQTYMQGVHTLLVEDDSISQKVGIMVLQELGAKVDLAVNGEQALLLLRQNQYDCVFLDIGLPDISGEDVAEYIHSSPKVISKDCLVVALTAHITCQRKPKLLENGFHEVLRKPITIQSALEVYKNRAVLQEQRLVLSHELASPQPTSAEEDSFTDVTHSIDELQKIFMDELSGEYAKMQVAFSHQDFKTLSSLTHRIQGASYYVDVPVLRGMIEELYTALSEGQGQAIKQCFDAFSKEVESMLSPSAHSAG